MTRNADAEIAEARERYRPQRVKVLFVAESPPSSGKFFYFGENNLLSHLRSAVRESLKDDASFSLKEDASFLNWLKEYGWFLDDLVVKPIDNVSAAQRERECREARPDLASRIRRYQPSAIVTILLRIRDHVEIAACRADSKACLYFVPFPGHGNQKEFRADMARILPRLHELTDLP